MPDLSALQIIVTMPDGVQHTASITGASAIAGLDIVRQRLADMNARTAAELAPGPPPKKYSNPAEFIKASVIDGVEADSRLYPSAAMKVLTDAAKVAANNVEAARKAAFDAARG